MSFVFDTYHVAKKAHYCYLCGRPIHVGERYNKRAGSTDGDFWSIHMHCFCSEVATKEYRDNDAWEFHDESEFRELLADHERARAQELGATPTDAAASLSSRGATKAPTSAAPA